MPDGGRELLCSVSQAQGQEGEVCSPVMTKQQVMTTARPCRLTLDHQWTEAQLTSLHHYIKTVLRFQVQPVMDITNIQVIFIDISCKIKIVSLYSSHCCGADMLQKLFLIFFGNPARLVFPYILLRLSKNVA